MTSLSILTTTAQTRGRVAAIALYAGESVGAVRRVLAAADIARELVDGAARVLRGGLD